MAVRRVPLNLFGMPFSLVGLGEIWAVAGHAHQVPRRVGEALLALAALVLLIVLGAYLRYLFSPAGSLRADLTDPAVAPYGSLVVITPLVLASFGIAPHFATVGRSLVDTFIVLTVIAGAWYTGQWIYGPLDLDKLHPGYFLPTVAGGLIASASAAAVGQLRLAQVMFGYGVICWFILASMILFRLFFRPFLPNPLVPTIAIEVAPAAVASLAYFAINGNRVDPIAAFVGGYGLLMVLAQIRLVPAYLRVKFAPSTWAFGFSWAAVGSAALVWVNRDEGHPGYTYAILAAVTALIGAIGVRTLIALVRRDLLPVATP
jgi:tellurite resistance protein